MIFLLNLQWLPLRTKGGVRSFTKFNFMKKLISILAAMLVTAAIASAETGGGEALLESIEMSEALSSKAMVEPLDETLYDEVLTHVNDYVAYLNATGVPVSATKVNQWMAMNKGFFTNQQLTTISEKLTKLDEENYNTLLMVEYKDPTISLVLSIVFGCLGVDRFYIGKIGAGVGKLLTAGGLGIWWLIDIFCIQDATRDVNYEELNEFLAMLK